jgi:hypothetical protein
MKHFKNLMKSSLGKNTTCGFHNEKILPDLKPWGIKANLNY